MGNNIKLNIEGIANTKNTVKQVLLYMNNVKQELKDINLSNNEEFNNELIKIINDINTINEKVENVNNWIDEVTNKFEQAEVSSIKAIENATINKVNIVSFSASKNATPNANIKLGKQAKSSTKTSGKSTGIGNLLKDALAKLVEAVIVSVITSAITSYTNSKQNNNSKSSNSSNTSNQKAERDWKEEAEEAIAPILKSIIEEMQKIVSFSIKQGKDMLEQEKTKINPKLTTGEFGISNYALYNPRNGSDILLVYLPGSGNWGSKIENMNGDLLLEEVKAGMAKKNGEKQEGKENYEGILPDINILFMNTDSWTTYRNSNGRHWVDMVEKFAKECNCDQIILCGYSTGAHSTATLANRIVSGQEPYNEIKELVKGMISVSGDEKNYKNSNGYLKGFPSLIVLGMQDDTVSPSNTLETSFGYMFEDNVLDKIEAGTIQSPYIEGNTTVIWNNTWDHDTTPYIFRDEFLWNWIHETCDEENGTVSKKDIENDIEELEAMEKILEEKRAELNGDSEGNINKEKANIEYKAENTKLNKNINEEEYKEIYDKLKPSIEKKAYAKAYSEVFEMNLNNGETIDEKEFVEKYQTAANEAYEQFNKEGLTEEEKEMYKIAFQEIYGEQYTEAYNK